MTGERSSVGAAIPVGHTRASKHASTTQARTGATHRDTRQHDAGGGTHQNARAHVVGCGALRSTVSKMTGRTRKNQVGDAVSDANFHRSESLLCVDESFALIGAARLEKNRPRNGILPGGGDFQKMGLYAATTDTLHRSTQGSRNENRGKGRRPRAARSSNTRANMAPIAFAVRGSKSLPAVFKKGSDDPKIVDACNSMYCW